MLCGSSLWLCFDRLTCCLMVCLAISQRILCRCVTQWCRARVNGWARKKRWIHVSICFLLYYYLSNPCADLGVILQWGIIFSVKLYIVWDMQLACFSRVYRDFSRNRWNNNKFWIISSNGCARNENHTIPIQVTRSFTFDRNREILALAERLFVSSFSYIRSRSNRGKCESVLNFLPSIAVKQVAHTWSSHLIVIGGNIQVNQSHCIIGIPRVTNYSSSGYAGPFKASRVNSRAIGRMCPGTSSEFHYFGL